MRGPGPTGPAISLRGITKSFRGNEVLHGVDFELRPGEVHALAGANGSGKSTLMKVIYGAHRPTSGTTLLRDAPVTFKNPAHALRSGIAAVPQELPLVRSLTVAENIFFGGLPARSGVVRWSQLTRRAREVLERVDGTGRIDPAAVVAQLDLAAQQLVSIARAIAHDADVIVFDEPTSSLDAGDTESLFEVIGALRRQGKAIGFISQRLDDILAVADRVTVLRDGRVVEEMVAAEATTDRIASQMVERGPVAAGPGRAGRAGDVALELDGVRVGPPGSSVSLRVGTGEVVGLVGLPGSGVDEVVATLLGRRSPAGGRIRLHGRDLTHASLRRRVRSGIAYLSGDRQTEGLVRTQTVAFNLTLALNSSFRLMPISHRRQARLVEQVVADVHLRPPDPDALVATLSGGNQQKVVVGRWLLTAPRLWLLNDPTRGVDVHSRSEIHALIRKQVSTTRSCVLMTSTDIRELLEVCDRLVLIAHGRVVTEVGPETTSEHEIFTVIGGSRPVAGVKGGC